MKQPMDLTSVAVENDEENDEEEDKPQRRPSWRSLPEMAILFMACSHQFMHTLRYALVPWSNNQLYRSGRYTVVPLNISWINGHLSIATCCR